MKVFLHNKNVLDIEEADTIALPIDGDHEGMEGNVARQFMKRLGVENFYELFPCSIEYPVSDCHWGRIEGGWDDETHFKYVCAISTLSHAQNINHKQKTAYALRGMLQDMESSGQLGTRIAMPVLTGGWRNSPIEALYLILGEADQIRHGELHLAELDTERYEMFKPIIG